MTYCSQIECIKVALIPNIDQRQDRKASAAICESSGGKFLGMAGAMG